MTEYKVHRINFVETDPQAVNCIAVEDSLSGRFAVCREDGTIEIWNSGCGSSKFWSVDFVIPSKIGRSIDSATWCNGRFFTSGLEGTVTEWDLGRLTDKTVVDACGGPVWCLARSPDKTQLAAGCEDGSVRLFDIKNDGLFLETSLDKQEFRVLSLAWSHCGNVIVTGSTDSTIRVYDVRTKRITSRISTDNQRQRNTKIWSMALTKDMTIITGNSIGQTQFWDLETCTLLKSFQAHEADVLTLCVTPSEDAVYSCGIDSRVVEFKYITEQSRSRQEWSLTKKLNRSVNHDIRSLCLIGEDIPILIAAGVDPRITKFNITKKEVRYNYLEMFPRSPPFSFAKDANILLFYDKNIIHLWKLPCLSGTTNGSSSIPHKLLELTSCRDDYIVCADLSSNGSMVAYADRHMVSVFSISESTVDGIPQISVKKVKIPQKYLKETQKLKLTSDASKLVFASSTRIGIMALDSDDMPVNFVDIDHEITLPWRLLEIDSSGSHIACVDESKEICIYSTKECRLISKVPKLVCCPMAIKFQPGTTFLTFVCTKKDLHRYDFCAEKFDHWCIRLSGAGILYNLPKVSGRFINIVFDTKDSSIIFVQSDQGFVKIKIGGKVPHFAKIGMKRRYEDLSGTCVSASTRYSTILYLDITKLNALVVVEQPLDAVLNSLPPALKLKQFGT
ncbi:U3 small nucleolar RNA-associated protein 4 homolog [Rhopilema esculentum]|uniref:U3 small nucleolar RNA-associated protein 4 homolog n=1 Tax=Rhopilema esculentum TaxID=499914 RepID=UPI0031D90EE2|eukprot:gene1741-16225_t